MSKILIAVIIAAVVILGGAMIIVPRVTGTDPNITEVGETFTFTIEGEVSKPGTYVLKDATTMFDLISAAGGTIHNTDERSYFEETKLETGNTYYIGGKYDVSDICSNKELDKANINKDSIEELTKINGITSAIASSIVSYRTSSGPFETLEGVLKVYGIGNATYRKIRSFIILHE